MVIFLTALIWPLFASVSPLQLVANKNFAEPGTYVNVVDLISKNDQNGGKSIKLDLDTVAARLKDRLDPEDREMMVEWLYTYGGVEEGTLSVDDMSAVVTQWNEKYDFALMPKTVLKADRNRFKAIDEKVQTVLSDAGMTIATKDETGVLKESTEVVSPGSKDFVNINSAANKFTFILGTDNFGRDVWTELLASILVSLRIGLIAGCVATAIGLTLGLLSGYLGGIADNIIVFITNLFTVVPSFIILVLIANALGSGARGVTVVAVIIGVTAWPWTCRSVRSQVLSLRNRDHVNISRLSGHSLGRVIVCDILPYVASYVVMALILQISSGILAESQLSMLGLGPSTTEYPTLGLMMSWATQFTAPQQGAWWAFFPIIISIALISFSLNLMNTGLDQVFNPQLRD
ncbi:MAG: ABC transporter permease [Oscillospiraceae bacterium]